MSFCPVFIDLGTSISGHTQLGRVEQREGDVAIMNKATNWDKGFSLG